MKYTCSKCGYNSLEWVGKCPSCGEWNSMVEKEVVKSVRGSLLGNDDSKIYHYSEIVKNVNVEKRVETGIVEFDRVIGGGFVDSQVVLLSGDPGIGKSTLLLSVLISISQKDLNVVYVSGEESINQLGERFNRISKGKLKKGKSNISFLASTNIDSVLEKLSEVKPDMVIFDSLQTILSEENSGVFGGAAQLRESAIKIVRYCKKNSVIGITIGHVNKEGDVSGPIMIEHLVDTVLYLEGEESTDFRVLRSTKNRYGKVSEIGVFMLDDSGMSSLSKDQNIFVIKRSVSVSGVAKGVVLTGTRPFLIEVQALCDTSELSIPRRVSKGIEYSKLQIICSVISKYTKYDLRRRDVYVNIPGGLKVTDGALDFSIAMAIISSYLNKPLGEDVGMIGELSLTGEIIPSNRMETRLSEMVEKGIKKIYVPKSFRPKKVPASLKLIKVENVTDLFPN